ncbi:MAG: hypothetical protein ACOCW3_05135 [Spirochaetota bacterium]
MKAVIRLLVRFLFWFALIALASSALVVAHAYVIGFDPSGAHLSPPFIRRVLHALTLVWPASVLLAGAIALFSSVRSMRAPAPAIGILFLVWTAALVAGGFIAGAVDADSLDPAIIVPERRLVRAGRWRVYALERDGVALAPLALYEEGRSPGFSVLPRADIDPTSGALDLPPGARPAGVEGDSSIDLRGFANSYPAMARTPALLAGLVDDMATTARLLALSGDRVVTGLLNLVALGVYLLGSWTLARLTRWPLFNAVLVLAALRLAFWLVPAVHTGVLRDVLIAGFDSRAIPFASAVLLAGLGAGLFAGLVFLPSLDEWRREVGHG